MTDPYLQEAGVTLFHGDCLDVLRELPDESVHAVVTDPPYGLEFMGRDWDGADGFRRSLNAADAGRENVFGRASRTSPEYRAGSVFEEWCEAWARECLRILKPGGHLLAFGGSRTWHRLAVGIEDAGFEMRDSIAWLYGSGFPKSLDVAKAIDKAGGESPEAQARVLKAARERAGHTRKWVATKINCTEASVRDWEEGRARAKGGPVEYIMASPAYRAAIADLLGYSADERAIVGVADDRRGDGSVIGLGHSGKEYGGATTDAAKHWEGWGTALKPAFEPIVVARKPLAGTVAANVLAHGTGALNINKARTGRGSWPTNVALDASQAAAVDEQTMVTQSRIGRPRGAAAGDGWGMTKTGTEYDDEGGASRFFPTFRYEAKAPTSERPVVNGVAHPTVKPLELMQWLVRLVTPKGGTVLEPFAGSGTTVEACLREGFDVIAIEREADYLPLIEKRIRKDHAQGLDFDWGDAS